MITKDDILKFKGIEEPCIQYRVLNSDPVLMYSKVLKKLCPHIRIEAIGFVPAEVLEKVKGSPDNKWAMDVKMKIQNTCN